MSFLVQRTGKKLFEQHLDQYTPKDPLYESYTDKNGKSKRRKVTSSLPPSPLLAYTPLSAPPPQASQNATSRSSTPSKNVHITSTNLSLAAASASAGLSS